MGTYKGLKGFNIQAVSSDPSNLAQGEIWYNTTSNTVKGFANIGASWSAGGDLGTGRGSTNGNGTATAGLMVSGGPPSSTTTACEEFSVGTTSVAANSTLTTS